LLWSANKQSCALAHKSLNDQSQQTTIISARLDLDPVRQSVNTATSAMMEAARLQPIAELVPSKTHKKVMRGITITP
jgi:hypothetical protein